MNEYINLITGSHTGLPGPVRAALLKIRFYASGGLIEHADSGTDTRALYLNAADRAGLHPFCGFVPVGH